MKPMTKPDPRGEPVKAWGILRDDGTLFDTRPNEDGWGRVIPVWIVPDNGTFKIVRVTKKKKERR